MKTRTFLLMLAALLLVAVGVADAFPSQEIIYTVRYSCIISPNQWGVLVGEWVTGCDGVTRGWGWEPGSGCTTTDITWGQSCSVGGGGGGGGGPDLQQ